MRRLRIGEEKKDSKKEETTGRKYDVRICYSRTMHLCCVSLSGDCTVVSLRQLERQLDRDKEKSDTELTAARAVHQDEVDKLTKQLQTLQSDNNLLMVSGS